MFLCLISLKHTGPTVGCLKHLGRLGLGQEQICSVCSAALEAFGTARTASAPIQPVKSEKVGCRPSEPLDSLIGLCASCMTILIGGVWHVWWGRILCAFCFSMYSVPSFPVFMFWSTGMRLAPPAVKEAYCILCKRRSYKLLWSWQHVAAVCFNATFPDFWVFAVCGGL